MDAARNKTAARTAPPAPAPAAQPGRTAHVQLQSLKVSSPSDPAEKEAEATARKVVRMPAPPIQSPHAARFTIARKAEGQPNVSSNVAAEISASTASGSPLPASVRRFMEPRFKTDFGNVRVHTNERSARLNRQLNARAFTVGNQIFFGRGRFQPESSEGRELLAHELTHTIQQGAAVQRSADVPVTQQSPPQVQRLGLSDALDYFADRANLIPGFRMFTIILGVNPINMSRVERSAANILRAVIEIIPGGALITQALDNHGVFDRVGAWVEQQINTLGMTGSVIRQAIDRFLDSLSWSDIFDLGGVWDRARRIFTEPIDRIFSFVRGLVSGIIRFVKEAILRPLARLAEGTRGYDLLKAVLGQDPITGDPYPRNAETLIGGFMKLIGQEEIWQNIQRANAVARAWAWFQGALSGLLGFVRQIPSLFVQAFQSLEIADIILVPRAFARIAAVFGGFIGQFFTWAGNTIWNLLEIIFSVVAPGVMVYLRRAAGAFRTILQNPIGFVGNLVRAGLLGLRQFATNFLTHLRASLIGWLTGAMSGANIYIPQGFNLREIIKFVLSVLGLTWQNIRQKLVRVVGETAVRAMETGFDIVMTLVTQGPAAAWEKIQESLSNLRDMVMEQIMTFVRDRVVQAAITRLVTSLNPAGAFIQAVIAIYNTVMFFVERLRQIAQVAASVIDSISAIASGALGAAANRVEQTMAGLLTLVISFLARIAGLGRVSDAVTGVINRVRQPIDRALDRVVEWIVAQARRLGRFVAQAGVPQDPNERLRLGMQTAVNAVKRLAGARVTEAMITPLLGAIKVRYGFRVLRPLLQQRTWHLEGEINPRRIDPAVVENLLELADAHFHANFRSRDSSLQPGTFKPAELYAFMTSSGEIGRNRAIEFANRWVDVDRVLFRSRSRGGGHDPEQFMSFYSRLIPAGDRPLSTGPESTETPEQNLERYRRLAGLVEVAAPAPRRPGFSDRTLSDFRKDLRQNIVRDSKYKSDIDALRRIMRTDWMGQGFAGELFADWIAREREDGLPRLAGNKIAFRVANSRQMPDRYVRISGGIAIIEAKTRQVTPTGETTSLYIRSDEQEQARQYATLVNQYGFTDADPKVGPVVEVRYVCAYRPLAESFARFFAREAALGSRFTVFYLDEPVSVT